MFGRSQLVTKGTIAIIVLLFIGTTWAEDAEAEHSDLQRIITSSSYLSGTHISTPSNDNMEEIVVSSKKGTVDSLENELENTFRYEFDVAFFPERTSTNIADHSELIRLDNRTGRTGFIEVFRVRFGGK